MFPVCLCDGDVFSVNMLETFGKVAELAKMEFDLSFYPVPLFPQNSDNTFGHLGCCYQSNSSDILKNTSINAELLPMY